MSSSISVSTDFNPALVEMKMGKNEIRKLTNTLGNMPNPNQMTKRGAMAIFETVCEKRKRGMRALSSVDDRTTRKAKREPKMMLQEYPSNISKAVTRLCETSLPRCSTRP